MRPNECAESRSDKYDQPIFSAYQIKVVFSQINIIPVPQNIGHCFANEMNRDKRFTEGDIKGKVQLIVNINRLKINQLLIKAMYHTCV